MEEPLLALRRLLAALGAAAVLLGLQACAVAPQAPPGETAPEGRPAEPVEASAGQPQEDLLPGRAEEPLPPPAAADTPAASDPGAAEQAAAEAPEPLPAMLDLTEPQANLWEHIRNGFAVSDLDDPLVRVHEDFYAARPDYLQRMFERCRPYLHFWVQEVDKRGMPTEIALLPMIESACTPMSLSRSKASGPWQFMAATGRKFGLRQDAWYDGRRDIIAATRAALDYLESLYDMFGTWYLALAAYNAGEGTVGRAIARNEAMGLRTDYVSLQLPGETRNYVPKLQAIKNIVARPEAYGVRLDAIPNAPHFTTVEAPPLLDLGDAARLAEIPLDQLVSLNAGYNRPVLHGGRAELVLPVDAAEVFLANLERNGARPTWQTYASRRGEALAAIARRHGISLARLRQINDLPAKQRNSKGEVLLVPARGGAVAPAPEPAAAARIHVVRRGDTLIGVAKRYGTTVEQLRRWNGLRGNGVNIGQKLVVRPAAPERPAAVAANIRAPRATTGTRRYVVKAGDTLYGIARQFQVGVDQILRPAGGTLRVGETVMIRTALAD